MGYPDCGGGGGGGGGGSGGNPGGSIGMTEAITEELVTAVFTTIDLAHSTLVMGEVFISSSEISMSSPEEG